MDPRSNDLAAKARPYLDRIEALAAERDASIRDLKEVYVADLNVVYAEARDDGVQIAALKATVKRRRLETKIAALPAKLDMDEAAQYDALAAAFAGTPFGELAKARAASGRPARGYDDDEDGIPSH